MLIFSLKIVSFFIKFFMSLILFFLNNKFLGKVFNK